MLIKKFETKKSHLRVGDYGNGSTAAVVDMATALAAAWVLTLPSVRVSSPGSQQSGVSSARGPVPHLSPGELGASQPAQWPHPGLQTTLD